METDFDFETGEVKVVATKAFSDGERPAVKCYGANDVLEGVAIMKQEGVAVLHHRQLHQPHPVPASGGRHLQEVGHRERQEVLLRRFRRRHRPYPHPDNVAAGPASYGLTDSMGRMHGDVEFAGSTSVPAHVEMMGLIGMGNNPMVGATVACAVAAGQV